MGLLSRMLGHASEADIESIEDTLEHALAEDEQVEKAFQLMRDLIIFTNHRMILVDRQGMTGRNIFSIAMDALPLFWLMCLAVVLLAAFPQLALWLPSTMLDAR